jgi:hypothetical protein
MQIMTAAMEPVSRHCDAQSQAVTLDCESPELRT